MSWNSVTASTATWVAGSSTAKTWSGQTVVIVPPPWAILSGVVQSDDGVDFILRASEMHTMRVSAERYLTVSDTTLETP